MVASPPSHKDSLLGSIGRRQRKLRYRFLRWWRLYQWQVFGGVIVIAFVLGVIGFKQYLAEEEKITTWWDYLYFAGQLFFNKEGAVTGDIPWTLQVARFLAPLATIFAVLKALAAVFARQLDQTRAYFARRHVVVCGLSRKGFYTALELQANGHRAIIIERDHGNELIPQAREQGLLVLNGDATQADMLSLARVHRADFLVAVSNDDRVNIQIAAAGRDLSRRKPGVLHCLAHVKDLALWERLQELEVRWSGSTSFVLECFNVFDRGATALLSAYPSVGADGPDDGAVLLVADGAFGVCLTRHLAARCRERRGQANAPLKVFYLGEHADTQVAEIKAHGPEIPAGMQLTALTGDLAHLGDGWRGLPPGSPAPEDVRSVFVCMDDDKRSLSPALVLVQLLRGTGTPVVLCMQGGRGVEITLGSPAHVGSAGAALQTFNVIEEMCRTELLFGGFHERVARQIHEHYVAAELNKDDGKRPPDPSLKGWADLSDELKEQNLGQARAIGEKLAAIGCDVAAVSLMTPGDSFAFEDAEIEALARMEHRRWIEGKKAAGWRYGPEHDEKARTHPDLVDWAHLGDNGNEKERDKDRNAVRLIPELLTGAGYAIVRVVGERLAPQIHTRYLAKQEAAEVAPGDAPGMVAWSDLGRDDLGRDLQEMDREQARAVVGRLLAIGCLLQRESGTEDPPVEFAFTAEEVEVLAREEHERWVDQRSKQGWTYGPVFDATKRISPCLVAYESLPKGEKQKDRDTVLSIPDLVASAGFRIVRERVE